MAESREPSPLEPTLETKFPQPMTPGGSPDSEDYTATTSRRAQLGFYLLVLLGGLTASLFVYLDISKSFFIGDDFINLRFFRNYSGSFLDFFYPSRIYSDPITTSRYKPLYVLFFGMTDWLFNDNVSSYHLLSIGFHGLCGAVTGFIALRLFRSRLSAVLAAALFICYRLNSQSVMWVSAGYRVASTFFTLLALVLFLKASGRRRVWWVAIFYGIGLLANPDLVVFPVFLWLAIGLFRPSNAIPKRETRVAVTCTLMGVAFVVANLVSFQRFPDLRPARVPDLRRFAVFFTDLVFPYVGPMWLKASITVIALSAAFLSRQKAIFYLVACATTGAFFWSLQTGYELTPRYFYLYTSFFCIALASIPPLLHSKYRRLSAWTAASSIVGLAVVNVYRMKTSDLVAYQYLSEDGRRLQEVCLHERARQPRRPPLRIVIKPVQSIYGGNLNFFEDCITVVDSSEATPDDKVIEIDYEAYESRLVKGFSKNYWYFPWFTSLGEFVVHP